MYALTLLEDGRINFVSIGTAIGNEVQVDHIPDGDIHEYKYINGDFYYDPLPKAEEPVVVSLEDRIAELEAQNEMLTECILELSELLYN